MHKISDYNIWYGKYQEMQKKNNESEFVISYHILSMG